MHIGLWTGSIIDWKRELAGFKKLMEPVFGREEVRQTFGHFIDGLFSGSERKTGWLMAEQAGLDRPYRMQSLLGRSRWNDDTLRNAMRAFVIDALGDAGGVLIVDETGFVKKGTHSVGVARQYSGTAGRIENEQVGVFQPTPACVSGIRKDLNKPILQRSPMSCLKLPSPFMRPARKTPVSTPKRRITDISIISIPTGSA
jgi:SRSO17 transposase